MQRAARVGGRTLVERFGGAFSLCTVVEEVGTSFSLSSETMDIVPNIRNCNEKFRMFSAKRDTGVQNNLNFSVICLLVKSPLLTR